MANPNDKVISRQSVLPALRLPLICLLVLCLFACTDAANPISIDNVQRKDAVSFENDILPILQKNCLACHSASEKEGNLVLESPQGMLKGGDTGTAAVPGRGSESLILTLASHQDDPVMPPEGNDVAAKNLSPAELGLLKLWIDQGAKGTGGIDSLSPKQWQPLPPGVHPVQAVALTEDGQFLACSRANQIFLYHVPTGQLITKLADSSLDTQHTTGISHRDLVQSLAFNIDGDLLASGGFREVKLWRRPRDLQRLNLAIGAAATAVAVSPDKQWIAVAGANHAIRLFRAGDGKPAATLEGHTGEVGSLRFTSDGKRLVSGALDQSVRVWNVADGKAQGIIETPSAVTAIELVNQEQPSEQNPLPGQLLVTGDSDKTIRVWELPDAASERIPSSPANLTKTVTSRDGSLMAMLDDKNSIRVVSLVATDAQPLGKEVTTWTVDPAVTALALARRVDKSDENPRHALLTGASDGSIRMWSIPEKTIIRQWAGEPKKVTSLAVSADGTVAASGLEDGAITLWDLKPVESEETKSIRPLEGNTKAITAMLFHSGGQSLFSTAADGSLRGYNTGNGQKTFATSHGAAVHDLAISPDEQVLATAGENATVRLWRTNGGAFAPPQITGFAGPVTSVAFSPDSKKVVAASLGEKPATRVHELPSGTLLQQFTRQSDPIVGCLALANAAEDSGASTNLSLLIASKSGVYQATATSVRTMTGHSQPITSLTVDPERVRHVYSGSLDGSIRRWSLDSGRAVQQINHGGPVNAIATSPDGKRLASAGENNRARLFRSNGQSIAEMRGDIRLNVGQTRAQQGLNSANARLNIAKRLFDEAEKDVPKKTEAEKKLADALATANKEVGEKQQAVDKAMTEKIAAEKAAIEASTAAKTALADKEQAELLAKDAAAAMQVAQAKMTQLQRALAGSPDSEKLKQLVTTAQQDLTTCQQKSQQLASAVKAPSDKASQMATSANTAAQKVNGVQKPYNDATTALRTAQVNQNLLSQQHVLAAKELKEAQDLVPVRKESLTRAETAKTDAEKAVAAANDSLKASEQPIRSIAFSPDGSVLVTAGEFSRFHSWDGNTGAAIAAFAGHSSPLRQVGFLDANTLVSASDDQTCRVWEMNPSWVLEKTIGRKDDPNVITHRATAVDFNRQSTQLLVAGGIPSRSGELQVFNISDGSRALYLPRAHDDVIYSARFSPDGKRIASGGADKYLRTFDVITSTQLRRFEGHTNYVLGVSWKSDGETIATSSADNTIKLWEAETGDQRRTINQQLSKHVTAVEFIGDTNNVISSSGDKRVRIHNGNNGGILRNFSNVKTWLHCVAVTPDSKIAAGGDAGGTVTIFNGTNGQVLQTLAAE